MADPFHRCQLPADAPKQLQGYTVAGHLSGCAATAGPSTAPRSTLAAATMHTKQIQDAVSSCLKAFGATASGTPSSPLTNARAMVECELKDQWDRLKIWWRNLGVKIWWKEFGVHKLEKESLGYKPKNPTDLKKEVIALLLDLEEAINEGS
jgi:hypothetical protein